METIPSKDLSTDNKALIAAVLSMGKGLIEFGSEVKRAEDTMNRIINSSTFLTPDEKHESYVYVTINSIFFRNGNVDVDFVNVLNREFNLDKVAKLNQLSRDYSAQKISIQKLLASIKKVLKEPAKKKFSWLAYSVLSSSVTLILNGSVLECALAAIIGLVTSQASGEIQVTTVSLVAQIVGSALCSVSFAYIIHASKSMFWPISVAGALTWIAYVEVTSLSHNSLLNTLVSVGILSLVSQYFAKRYKAPMTIFFIPSLVALVPGITMFVGLSQLGTGQTAAAITTLIGVMANLLGLTIGSIAGDEVYRLFMLLKNKVVNLI